MSSPCPTTLIDNSIELLPDRPYGVILGLSPSKGARSPVLWRAAFAALGMEADFHPFDVSKENLPALIQALQNDPRFIGGACAVPYKEDLSTLLPSVEPEAQDIGAVNAVYRDQDGNLRGANTDGEGGLSALKEISGNLQNKSILLLGLGGAGKALATYIAHAGIDLMVWNRDPDKSEKIAGHLTLAGKRISKVNAVNQTTLSNIDVLVNCTSSGFSADGSENSNSPIDPVLLTSLPSSAIVYDIIYQPLETCLLKAAAKNGLMTLNGKPMNQKQAAIAFCKAVKGAPETIVAKAMNAA